MVISMRQEKYYEAYLDDYDKVIVFMSRNSYEGVSNKFYLKDDQGHLFDLHIQSIETTQNNYNNIHWHYTIPSKSVWNIR